MATAEEIEILKDCFRDDPEEILDAIGIEYKEHPRLEVLCPFHADKNLGSAIVKNGYFRCFSCGATADVFGLIEKSTDASFTEAIKTAASVYGVVTSTSNENSKFFLTKEEKEALDFPSTALGLGKVMRNEPDVYRKIVLSRAAQMIARYQNLDRLYGSRDGDEAYVFSDIDGVSPVMFTDIHKKLKKKMQILRDLQKRL